MYKLNDVVDVDYYMPGCPPAADQVKAVLSRSSRGELPAKGSVVGASELAVCDDCPRDEEREEGQALLPAVADHADPDVCLLEQGILCAGPATRSGCGVRCPSSGIPCRGCYGPLPNVVDQGAKFLSAVVSIIDSKDPQEIEKIIDGLPDFPGYAYRFGLPSSLLQRSVADMTRKISIDPITRLEGHGKIEIFLDDDGAVEDCFFQIPELRGFERFVVGRPIEELPRIVTRICGVCPAATTWPAPRPSTPASAARSRRWPVKLRQMYYNAHFMHSHIAHFYALAAPDFVMGPTPTLPSATSSAWSPRSASRSAAP